MDLILPPPPGFDQAPQWTGSTFQIGGTSQRILSYGTIKVEGWSNDLNQVLDDNVDHYMNVASRQNVARAMGQWVNGPKARILEAGCSSGHTLQTLRQAFPGAEIVGSDPFEDALKSAADKLPGVPLLQFDLLKCPLPDGFADAVALLNVLEHVKDDNAAIAQVFRVLRPSGIACIEVPSGPGLFDLYDRTLCHYRRYSMRDLTTKMQQAGFEILERSHIGFFIYPAFWAVKKMNQRHDTLTPEQQNARVVSNIQSSGNGLAMKILMSVENRVRQWVYLPAGIRCFVVGRRPA